VEKVAVEAAEKAAASIFAAAMVEGQEADTMATVRAQRQQQTWAGSRGNGDDPKAAPAPDPKAAPAPDPKAVPAPDPKAAPAPDPKAAPAPDPKAAPAPDPKAVPDPKAAPAPDLVTDVNEVRSELAAKPSDLDFDWGQLRKRAEPSMQKMSTGAMWDSLDADCFTVERELAEAWADFRKNGGPQPPEVSPSMRSRCTNHHWSLLGQCVPSKITITVKVQVINRIKTKIDSHTRTVKIGDREREQVHPYYSEFKAIPVFTVATTYEFTSITPLMSSGGIYQTSSDTNIIVFPGQYDLGELILFLIWFILTCHIFVPGIINTIRMPMEIYRAKQARKKSYARGISGWDECVMAAQKMMTNKRFSDRYAYTFAPIQFLIQFLGIQLIIAFVYSGWGFFFDTSALPMPIVRTDKGTWCAAQESLSFFQYIHHCREEAHMGPVNSISEICWGLLFNSCARNNHRIAILTGFVPRGPSAIPRPREC
jgi:hypothetical protein